MTTLYTFHHRYKVLFNILPDLLKVVFTTPIYSGTLIESGKKEPQKRKSPGTLPLFDFIFAQLLFPHF
jgi:hypothetical protein